MSELIGIAMDYCQNNDIELALIISSDTIRFTVYKSGTIWKTDIASLVTVNFAPEQQIWVMP